MLSGGVECSFTFSVWYNHELIVYLPWTIVAEADTNVNPRLPLGIGCAIGANGSGLLSVVDVREASVVLSRNWRTFRSWLEGRRIIPREHPGEHRHVKG